MGAFGNAGGGRTRMGTKVMLNVYDLAGANDLLFPVGLGLHHSGVEISGVEYSFASGGGIFEGSPKVAPGAKFREQVYMGTYDGGSIELQRALDELRQNFGPSDYHLIRKNCNTFCNALCWKLLNKPIPGYVNRVADIGHCCNCLLPKKFLEAAPVGDPNRSQQQQREIALSRKTTAVKPAFTGTGSRLGGTASSSTDSGWTSWGSSGSDGSSGSRKSKPEDELTDRREKARKAALARLEKNRQQQTSSSSSSSEPPPPPPPYALSKAPPPPPPPVPTKQA